MQSKQPAETDWAWLAGIIDGEGCIGIYRTRSDRVGHTNLFLQIKMTHKPTLERVAIITGMGSVRSRTRNGSRKIAWNWSVRGQKAAKVLRATYYHMTTKREEAGIYLVLCKMKESRGAGRRIKVEEKIRIESLVTVAQQLKRKEFSH